MPAPRAGARRLKPLAESLRSPHLSLSATPSPTLPLSAQGGGSGAETGLRRRKRTGKKVEGRGELPGGGRVTLPQSQALRLHRGPDGQRIENVERVPEFPLLF